MMKETYAKGIENAVQDIEKKHEKIKEEKQIKQKREELMKRYEQGDLEARWLLTEMEENLKSTRKKKFREELRKLTKIGKKNRGNNSGRRLECQNTKNTRRGGGNCR